ncbi:ABC transporter permease [Acidobacteriota bacterium]
MKLFLGVFGAEILKIKRSLAFWLAVLSPFVVVFLQFVIVLDRGETFFSADVSSWIRFARQTTMFWSLLMLPLFITLETSLLGAMEHSGQNWKHLFAQPVSRGMVYSAKQIAAFCLIGLSQLILVGYIILAGWLLGALKPALGFKGSIPFTSILIFAGLSFVSSWFLIALHSWVGMRWKNFAVAIGFGIIMTIAGILVINSNYANYYPWTLPGVVMNGFRDSGRYLPQLFFGSIGGIVAAMLGGWEFTRRDVI